MDFPQEGKYNVQGIQIHLYSLVKQLLSQHLKSSCRKGRRGGREEAVPREKANTKLLQAWFKSWFIKRSKVQDITLLLTTTPDHKEARGMDAEIPLRVVIKAVLWLTLPKPSQTWGMKEALQRAVTAPMAKKHNLAEAFH